MSNPSPFKRALITGATGYIGSNLVHHLVKQCWDVHIITRSNSDLKVLDTVLNTITVHRRDGTSSGIAEVMANAKPEIVFHLASLFLAQHKTEDIEALISSNLLFSTQLVEAMAVNGIRYLVNTGTSWQHYNNDAYNPVCLYAATKQAFEAILEYYIQVFKLKTITLKLFDTYGPNDPRYKLIPLLGKIKTTQENLLMSPGDQLIDMVYIGDVINAYLVAARRLLEGKVYQHESYGISSGHPVTLRELVHTFECEVGNKLPMVWGGRPYRDREVMKTWDKFHSLPEWKPTMTFPQGLVK